MPAAKITRADREQVKATFVATHGDAVETAKRHNLTRWHVSQLAKRGQWPFRPLATARAVQVAQDAANAVVIRAQPSAVNSVNVTAADAISAVLSDYGTRTKAGFAKAAARYAEHVAEQPAEALQEHAQAAKAWVGAVAPIHGWQREGSPSITLNLGFFGSSS